MGELSAGKFEVTQVRTPESALSASTPLSPQSLLAGDFSKQRLLPNAGMDLLYCFPEFSPVGRTLDTFLDIFTDFSDGISASPPANKWTT